MGKRSLARLPLQALVELAVPLLQRAARELPRRGAGRPPVIPDWVLGTLIMVAVLKQKKSKSAQYAYLLEHRTLLLGWMGADVFPGRSTYFERYRQAHRLFETAIRVQGQQALREGVVDARCVAADKSVLSARGPLWHQRQRRQGFCPRGVDRDSTWTYSEYHGWIQGYGYEVVITASHRGVNFPLLASVDQAHVREHRTFEPKIAQLPWQTRFILLDMGYDSNALAEAVEWDSAGRRTGRFYLCPPAPAKRSSSRAWRTTRERLFHRNRREARRSRLKQVRFRRLYVRRGKTIEPFNDHFKGLFELHDQVWHRSLDNNRTQVLAAIFCYQLLVRRNLLQGHHHRRIKNLLNTL
jgi:Transposase DDE domain